MFGANSNKRLREREHDNKWTAKGTQEAIDLINDVDNHPNIHKLIVESTGENDFWGEIFRNISNIPFTNLQNLILIFHNNDFYDEVDSLVDGDEQLARSIANFSTLNCLYLKFCFAPVIVHEYINIFRTFRIHTDREARVNVNKPDLKALLIDKSFLYASDLSRLVTFFRKSIFGFMDVNIITKLCLKLIVLLLFALIFYFFWMYEVNKQTHK
jgi:hypothetical protein